jgi:hypothetical protein
LSLPRECGAPEDWDVGIESHDQLFDIHRDENNYSFAEFFNGKTPEPGSDDGGYDSSPADEAIGAPWAVSMPIC